MNVPGIDPGAPSILSDVELATVDAARQAGLVGPGCDQDSVHRATSNGRDGSDRDHAGVDRQIETSREEAVFFFPCPEPTPTPDPQR